MLLLIAPMPFLAAFAFGFPTLAASLPGPVMPIARPEPLNPALSAIAPLPPAPQLIARVTSVANLSDVRPTDWAFQALQALVERYGVIAGYPDGTFRGNRAMTRYEFAAGLNAALDRVNELIAAGKGDQVTREDLATLDRLQKEFSKELTTLRGRVDSLEGRVARLEMFQFSTTTKLTGQAIFVVNGGSQSNGNAANTIFASRVRLSLDTSFSGRDRLHTELQAQTRTPVSRASGSAGVGVDAGGYLADDSSSLFYLLGTNGPGFQLNRLSYRFPVGKDINVTVFPRGYASDYVDRNRYATKAEDNVDNFSTVSIVSNILLFGQDFNSAGAAVSWNPKGGPFTVRAVYAAQDATVPSPSGLTTLPAGFGSITDVYGNPRQGQNVGSDKRGGLFGDPYVGIVELEYAPSNKLALRAQYAGGNIGGAKYEALGANVEYAISAKVGLFGRFGHSSKFFPFEFFGNAKPSYWSAGVVFSDVLAPGATAGLAIAQPLIFRANAVQTNVTGTQTNIEAYYSYPVNPNIKVTPLVQVIIDPLNNRQSGTIFTGSVKTVFSF